MTQCVDALDFDFKLREPRIHFGRKVHVRVLPFRRQALKLFLRGDEGGSVFLRKLHRMRIGAAHTVSVGKVDMDGNPFPALGLLNLGGNAVQLLDDKPIQKRGIFIEAAAIFREQVADDGAACFRIGLRADEDRTPIRRRHIGLGQVTADERRIAIVGQVLVNYSCRAWSSVMAKAINWSSVKSPSR